MPISAENATAIARSARNRALSRKSKLDAQIKAAKERERQARAAAARAHRELQIVAAPIRAAVIQAAIGGQSWIRTTVDQWNLCCDLISCLDSLGKTLTKSPGPTDFEFFRGGSARVRVLVKCNQNELERRREKLSVLMEKDSAFWSDLLQACEEERESVKSCISLGGSESTRKQRLRSLEGYYSALSLLRKITDAVEAQGSKEGSSLETELQDLRRQLSDLEREYDISTWRVGTLLEERRRRREEIAELAGEIEELGEVEISWKVSKAFKAEREDFGTGDPLQHVACLAWLGAAALGAACLARISKRIQTRARQGESTLRVDFAGVTSEARRAHSPRAGGALVTAPSSELVRLALESLGFSVESMDDKPCSSILISWSR